MSCQLDALLKGFSPETRQIVSALWDAMPPDLRRTTAETLGTVSKMLESKPQAAVDVIRSVKRSLGPAFTPGTRVAVVGPVNVGKSSLYNALVPEAVQRAAVSPLPGTTRSAQVADVGLFQLADTPGADSATETGEAERAEALDVARNADFLLVVFDATRGIPTSDRDLYRNLAALGKRHLVVLNKIDLTGPRERKAVVEAAATALGLAREEVLATSAVRGLGTDRLVLEIAAAEPRLLGHLGQVMAPLRRQLAMQAVRRTTISAMLVGLTPIPMLDMIPLTALQISMILTIARIYDRPMTTARAGEAIATFGLGMLARSMFAQIAKLGGVPGWILAGSVAGSATAGMGYAAIAWFDTGRRPSRSQVERSTRQLQSRFMRFLQQLGRRKLRREALREELEGIPELFEEA